MKIYEWAYDGFMNPVHYRYGTLWSFNPFLWENGPDVDDKKLIYRS
jgi:hypothetical protein